MAGDDVDLVDLHLAVEDDLRRSDGEPLPQRLGHGLRVRHPDVEFPGDLPVGEVQAHQVEAEHPDPERPVVPR